MSRARLLRLKISCERSLPDDATWLVGALDRVRAGESADVALELAGDAAANAAKHELLRAAEMLDPDCTLSVHRLAGMLANAIEHFKADHWESTKGSDRPPKSLGVLDRVFWTALTCSEAIPCSQGRIHELLMETRRAPQSQKRVQDFLTQNWNSVRPRERELRSPRLKKGECTK